MNARKKIGSLMCGAAMAAAIVGMTAGPAPASASPRPSGAFLAIADDPANPLTYRMVVTGTFPMQQTDAVGFINNINTGKHPGGMVYSVFGTDGGGEGDQIFYRFYPGAASDPDGYLRATSEGLTYQRYISVARGDLNEDSDGADEIWAHVVFRDADGGVRVQDSQEVVRHF